MFSATDCGTLVDLLRWRACHEPDKTGWTFLQYPLAEERNLTYRDLHCRACEIGVRIQNLAPRGSRALLLYNSNPEYIPAFFGCLYASVIAVPTYPPRRHAPIDGLLALIRDSGAVIVLTSKAILAEMEPDIAQTPMLQTLQWVATDAIDSSAETELPNLHIDPDAVAFLQYTSGSTGSPKGVMVTHSNLLHNEGNICKTFETTSNSLVVGWLPLFHDMGLIGNVLHSLYVGARCVVMSPVAFIQKPIRWLRAISDYRGTVSGGPDFAYDLCASKITPEQAATLDLSCWEVAFNGAEPVRPETLDRFTAAFTSVGFRREAFFPCYGLAEATLFVSGPSTNTLPSVYKANDAALGQNRVIEGNPNAGCCRPVVSCGHQWQAQQVVIVDPGTLTRCAQDQVGEIWVSGPSVAQGYWNRPVETNLTFHAYLSDTGEGPFLRTGDLGFIHKDLYVTGRLKDIVIICGRNYYPQDIEAIVGGCHPALEKGKCAAFSVDREGSERLVILQEVKPAYRRQLDTPEVIGNIREAVARHFNLQVFEVVLLNSGGVHRTSSGKIQRQACRAHFLANTLNRYEEDVMRRTTAAYAASASLGVNSRGVNSSGIINQARG